MKSATAPFVRLIIPFTAGISLAGTLEWPVPYLIPTLGVLFIVYLLLVHWRHQTRWRWSSAVVGYLLLFGVGYMHTIWYDERNDSAHFDRLPEMEDITTVIGTVYDAPGLGGKRIKVPLRVEAVRTVHDSLIPVRGHVLLFVERDTTETQTYRYGDRLMAAAQIAPTQPMLNPHGFDYARYLHFQNIHYQAFVSADEVQQVSSGHGSWAWRQAFFCRERLLELLSKHFNEQQEYSVAAALLVGYTDDLPEDLRQAYADTGSMHALAVSGTHVGLLYVGILWLLGRIPIRGRRMGRAQQLIALVAIWAFAFLTGATPSVLRATVMFSAWIVGRLILRPNNGYNVLAASAFVLLFFNPYFLYHVGFQLSYAAVLGMMLFYPMILKVMPAIKNRWLRELNNMLWVGVAAQLGTLPMTLYYFHQFPCYFWLAGWVVVVGGALFLWGGFFLIVLDFIFPWLADWLGQALFWLVWGMNRAVIAIQQLPGSVVSGIWITEWVMLLLFGVLACMALGIQRRSKRWVLAATTFLAAACLLHGIRYGQQITSAQMTWYATPKLRLNDVRSGHQLLTATEADSTVLLRTERRTAQPHRWASGVSSQPDQRMDFAEVFKSEYAWHCPPVSQFFTLKCATVDATKWVRKAAAPLPVDYLVLSADARVSVAESVAKFPAKMVVFDGTNRRKTVRQWRDECDSLGIKYHDLMTDGALVIDIEQ
jgi:competence protein ComEC